MYQLLKQGDQNDAFTFSVEHDGPDQRVLQKMLTLGLLATENSMYGGRVVKVTAAGLQALERARADGVERLTLVQEARPIHFHQTVHGTANTQVGDHNTMQVRLDGSEPSRVLAQLAELRALVTHLSPDDQEEALSTLERAETAVQKGAWERVKTYGSVLLGLGSGAVEFATKVKALFGL